MANIDERIKAGLAVGPGDVEFLKHCGLTGAEIARAAIPPEVCPENPSGHEPDFSSIVGDWDGEGFFADVSCKHCGRSGCLGKLDAEDIAW